MAVHHVIGGDDRGTFLDCRRAWDLSARERRNLEPARPTTPLDVQRAVREALAVYYFPGMWDWTPAIVLPLVRKAYTDSVTAQRARYLAAHELTALPPGLAATTAQLVDLGLATVEAYASWAPEVDDFAPIQVLAEFDVQVPDPRSGDRELVVGAQAVRYRDRADLVVMDADNRYWLLEHRFVDAEWPVVETVLRDDRCLSWCWTWEHDNPGQHVQGTIYNELRVATASDSPVGPAPTSGARSTVAQNITEISLLGVSAPEYDLRIRFGEGFRRLDVPRRHHEVRACGTRLAEQIAEMIDDRTNVYPNPSTTRCGRCAFLAPCLALDAGEDSGTLLAESYRPRQHATRAGTLGARTWSLGRGAAPPMPDGP